jgi:sucrose-6-phosphate hydrolase SacC (GH32 family)
MKQHFARIGLAMLGILFGTLRTHAADPEKAATPAAAGNPLVADPTRPTYHLISHLARAHCADPNFIFFWKGQYHLFYICEGYAHVSSTDLLHWREHPAFHGPLCSGGIFVNKAGRPTAISTSAWEKGKPVLYTALDDELDRWSAPVAIDAKIAPSKDASKMVCWDPDIWTDGTTTYALQGNHPLIAGREATVLKSTDQKNWEYVGSFLSRDMPDVMRNPKVPRKNEDISCPNFFKIGDKWMLLCISHIRGCRYYLGDWRNEQFTPTFHARMNWSLSEGMKDGDHGGEVFAPESVLTPDGRRVMWAWLFASSQKKVGPTWKEVFSLPRELSLPDDGVLRIKPLRELEQLRESPVIQKDIVVEGGTPYRLKDVAGDAIEIMATIEQGDAKSCGLRLLCDKANAKGIDLVVEPAAKTIKLGATTAPLELKPGEDLRLRVFIDRSIVEVFANDRQAVVKQHDYTLGDVGVCLLSDGGKTKVREVKAWNMTATNR